MGTCRQVAVQPLQDLVTKMFDIREQFDELATSTLHYIYENTGSGNPLRRLMVSQIAPSFDGGTIQEASDYMPHEFLVIWPSTWSAYDVRHCYEGIRLLCLSSEQRRGDRGYLMACHVTLAFKLRLPFFQHPSQTLIDDGRVPLRHWA
jgi:hypothetical protein